MIRQSDIVSRSLGPAPIGAPAASLLATLLLGVSEPALAQACGPLVGGSSVTCTSAGNTYPNGISYNQTDSQYRPEVSRLTRTSMSKPTGTANPVQVGNMVGGAAAITANGATISSSGAAFNYGLVAQASGGNAIITSSGANQYTLTASVSTRSLSGTVTRMRWPA